MRTRDGTTWRQLAEPIVFGMSMLGMVPFIVLMTFPAAEHLNRPFGWLLFVVWAFAQSILVTWAMASRRSPAPAPPPNLRLARIIDLQERQRTRDALQRRLARLREVG